MAKNTRKLTTKKISKHFSNARRNKISSAIEKKSQDDDYVLNFYNLCTKFKSYITEYGASWKVSIEDCLLFYKIDVSDRPTIVASIKIDKNLKVCAFTQYGEVTTEYLNHFLNEHLILENWSQLKTLLQYLGADDIYGHINIKHNLLQVSKFLRECLESKSLAKGDFGLKAKIEFLFSQIFALTENKYNPDVIFLAYSIYLKSSSCYSYLQKLEGIILPTEEYLMKYINKNGK